MIAKSSILLWGGSSKARIIAAMVEELDVGSIGLVFDSTLQKPAFDTPAIFSSRVADLRPLLATVDSFVVCVGGENGYARVRVASGLTRLGLRPLSLIHPSAYIDATSRLGARCQVMPRAVVHKFVEIGDDVIINTAAVVDHECQIGPGVHIMGGAALAGRVRVASFASIGTNATVLPDIRIGEGALVGAGAVVTRDVPDWTVVAGVPARSVKLRTPTYLSADLDALVASF